MKKAFHANGKKNKAGKAILLCDKTKIMVRGKGGHYIMTKKTIQQEDIALGNTQAPNLAAPRYVRQIFMDIKERLTVIQSY